MNIKEAKQCFERYAPPKGELGEAWIVAINAIEAIDKIDNEVVPLCMSQLDFIGGYEIASILNSYLEKVR